MRQKGDFDRAFYLCHGADGVDGTDGADGPPGADDIPGPEGASGNAGAQGPPGADGEAADPCTVTDHGDGTATVTCPDGSEATVGTPARSGCATAGGGAWPALLLLALLAGLRAGWPRAALTRRRWRV